MKGVKDKMKKICGVIIILMAMFCLMGMNVFATDIGEDNKITVVKSEDEVSFDITLDGEDTESGKVYVALYNGEVLTGLKSYSATKNKTIEFMDIDTYSSAKIMWWDEQNKPMCDECVVQGGSENIVKDSAYAYVLKAQYQKDSGGYLCVKVQILDESDNIHEKYLASNTTLYNFDENYGEVLEGLGENVEDRVSIDFTSYSSNDRSAVMALASSLVNNMIVYSVNDNGDIRSITMPSIDDANFTYGGAKTGEFNTNYKELGDIIIGENTYVFLVDAPEYAGAELADDEKCGVKVGYELENNVTYDYVAFDMDENDVAGAVVVLNTEFKAEEDDSVTDEEDDLFKDRYAYVLKAQYEKDTWGDPIVRVQILDKSGDIYEAFLAQQTALYNFDENFSAVLQELGKDVYSDRAIIDFSKCDANAVKLLARALINNVIVYSANDDGEVMSITMPSRDEDAKFTWNGVASGEFNANYMELGDVIIGDDTYVFLIDAQTYREGAFTADEDNCLVEKSFVLDDNTIYDYVAFDIDENDVAGAVLVLGFDIAVPYMSTNIAVIDKVKPHTSGGYDVYKLSYYTDGELREAVVDIDVCEDLGYANRGDVYKLQVIDGVIYGAYELLTFIERTNDEHMYAYPKDATSTPYVYARMLTETDAEIRAEDLQAFFMGAVVEKKTSGRYVIALAEDGTGELVFDDSELHTLRQENANVYVYDPNQTGDSILKVGSMADVDVDEKLFNGDYEIEDEDGNAVDSPAFGMADYVFVRQYDGEIEDIVIYKNYLFDYSTSKY